MIFYRTAIASLVFSLWVSPAVADLLNISSPNGEEGLVDIGIGNAIEYTEDGGRYIEHDLELDYGMRDWWKVGLEFGIEQQEADKYRYTVTTVKNTFRFMKQDASTPLSAAFRLELEKAHLRGEADAMQGRFLLQRNDGNISTLVNFSFTRDVGADRNEGVDADVRASARYKFNRTVTAAVEYLGDVGSLHELDQADEGDHRIGPVLRGDIAQGASYEVGYLAGISEGAPDHSLKLNIGYSFK